MSDFLSSARLRRMDGVQIMDHDKQCDELRDQKSKMIRKMKISKSTLKLTEIEGCKSHQAVSLSIF